MIVLILLAFVGMLTGIFLILGMTPFTFAEELTKPLSGRQQPISKRIQQVNHPKEPKGIRKTVLEAREMLILTGKGGKFAAICAFSLFLAAMGAVICIVIQNYFMLPVLAAGMGLLPFWYVLFTSHSYKKLMNNEIETGLSIITSSVAGLLICRKVLCAVLRSITTIFASKMGKGMNSRENKVGSVASLVLIHFLDFLWLYLCKALTFIRTITTPGFTLLKKSCFIHFTPLLFMAEGFVILLMYVMT